MSDVIIKALWIYGLAIVVSMAVAVVIKVIVVVLNAMERKPEAAPKAAPTAAPAPAFDLLADHVAAISAAVYSMMGSHRIVHIEEQRHGEWVVEGRLAHHTSHAVSHHPKQ
jgi:hypothetical protein